MAKSREQLERKQHVEPSLAVLHGAEVQLRPPRYQRAAAVRRDAVRCYAGRVRLGAPSPTSRHGEQPRYADDVQSQDRERIDTHPQHADARPEDQSKDVHRREQDTEAG